MSGYPLDTRQVENNEYDSSQNAQRVEKVGGSAVYQGVNKPGSTGTAVALDSSQAVHSVTVQALSSNGGSVYVGNSNVTTSSFGVELAASDKTTLYVDNLDLVYLAIDTSGDGASYIAT